MIRTGETTIGIQYHDTAQIADALASLHQTPDNWTIGDPDVWTVTGPICDLAEDIGGIAGLRTLETNMRFVSEHRGSLETDAVVRRLDLRSKEADTQAALIEHGLFQLCHEASLATDGLWQTLKHPVRFLETQVSTTEALHKIEVIRKTQRATDMARRRIAQRQLLELVLASSASPTQATVATIIGITR